MTNYILAAILLILALGGISLRKTYFYLPVRELKRRAEHHDTVAAKFYSAVAYGNSLRSLLWLYIGLTSAGSIILLARQLPVWASLLIVAPLLWAAFSLLPATRLTKPSTQLTLFITPAIARLLNYLHPALNRGADIVEKRYTRSMHTQLFEREDFMELIERQQAQEDSRLSGEELEIIKRALSFSDRKVIDILTPRKAIKIVLADDTIGPILITELHENKQSYALVRETAKGAFVGTLSVRQLGLRSSGSARQVMDSAVYYLHEEDSLSQALHAFFATNKSVFVVVNSFEEFTGIVTIESILKELLGHIPGDDFDQYANPAAVAARHTKPKKSEKPGDEPVKTENEVVE
ncbi:MAG TPA: CBS domain-containing protein [Verrucomicrobiae bacterium]|nr:CBS domain-containing protein [Verrucomicrobiae bacterium]